MQNTPETVLAIDVGTAIVGWGVVQKQLNKNIYTASGAIFTAKEEQISHRLLSIFQELNLLIQTYKPDAIAIEDLFFFKNNKTVISVSEARGVILLAASLNKIPDFTFTPLQVKSAVTGYGRAEKKQVQFMVTKILGLKEIPKPDDIADALALAICYLNTKQYDR
ncbi:MAG: crossover junction endodeoxyribonuclease RuvC [bacterium]